MEIWCNSRKVVIRVSAIGQVMLIAPEDDEIDDYIRPEKELRVLEKLLFFTKCKLRKRNS